MIKKCNFKQEYELVGYPNRCRCELTSRYNSFDKEQLSVNVECPGEDNCILYQIYKQIYGTYDYREHFTKMITDGLIGEHEREEVIPLKEKKPRTYHKHAVTNPNDPGPYTKGLPKELPIKTIDSLLSKKKTTKDGTQTVTWAEVMACAGNEEKLNELFESKRGKKK